MKRIFAAICLVSLITITACGPKEIVTDDGYLKTSSEAWIPFVGTENVVFKFDTANMLFAGGEKESYFENVRYMTDQGSFIGIQEDYYADLERQQLSFNSEETDYFIHYYLEHNQGELGEWDILKVSVGDGDYYQNEMKMVTYESESSDKGENFTFKKELVLNGVTYKDVYYKKQERRPFEIYYNKSYGVFAFKVSPSELWSISQDTIQ